MTKLTINITKEILEQSKDCMDDINIGKNCAIALATRDVFPKAWVWEDIILPNEGERNCREKYIDLPIEAMNFIHKFDKLSPNERLNMQPFSFEIEIPDKVIDNMSFKQLEELKKLTTIDRQLTEV